MSSNRKQLSLELGRRDEERPLKTPTSPTDQYYRSIFDRVSTKFFLPSSLLKYFQGRYK